MVFGRVQSSRFFICASGTIRKCVNISVNEASSVFLLNDKGFRFCVRYRGLNNLMLLFSNRELSNNPIEVIQDDAFRGLVKLQNL